MKKPRLHVGLSFIKKAKGYIFDFCDFFFLYYLRRKIVAITSSFEKNKNKLVRFFLMKRGRYNRPFLHFTTMGVLGIGVLIAPYLADTYPIFAQASTDLSLAENQKQSIIVGENVFETQISDKPRDEVITYTVQKGDTISTVARKFQVSEDTIKWENDLSSDTIGVGDTLKILPVTGIAHKVTSGDTVYTIAKKYDTEAQKIVDFPFNEFANPETFSLIEGQLVVVPDGVQPAAQPVYQQQRRETYIAQGPVTTSVSGFTWPVRGGVSQFASWYHMALDITANVGTPVVASHNGRVSSVNVGSWDGGYGTNVRIQGPDGSGSLYAHMSSVNVSAGQNVVGGQTIVGWVGMTGRTTGPHLHFEISRGGVLVNPMSFLQ